MTNEEKIKREEADVAFVLGAEVAKREFLKSLWHDGKETPKKGRAFLAALQLDDGLGFWAVDGGDHGTWILLQYDGRVTKWCYISDILPEAENNND